jgi:pectin methylesterase-like acyl-CoA thioesterase
MRKAIGRINFGVSTFRFLVVLAFASRAGEQTPIASSNAVPEVGSISDTLVVSRDGAEKFKTVQGAINAAATGTVTNPTVIRIKPGTYKELIYIQREKRFLHLIGENPTNTVLTYDLNAKMSGPDGKPIGTFRTPSALFAHLRH